MAELRSLIRSWSRAETEAAHQAMRDEAEIRQIRRASMERRMIDRLIEALADHDSIVVD